MTPSDGSKSSRNLAARMGRWSAGHWKTATFGWLAFVIAAVAIGHALGTKHPDPVDTGVGESGHVDRLMDRDFKQNVDEQVLVRSTKLDARDPQFKAAVRDTIARLEKHEIVTKIESPYGAGSQGQISKDGHSALIQFELRETNANEAELKVGPVMDTVKAAQAAHPELEIEEFGTASAGKELNEQFTEDLGKAGVMSLPLTLGILILAFGALVAAGIPVLLGLTAVVATMGLIALPSQIIPLDENIDAIVLLVGLAVAVDYSMFYLKREREERAAGRGERAALEAAAATSGRAVLISGLTVMVAMAGLFFTGADIFTGFGIATIMVVAAAVLGSLTVLPALLSRLGDRVEKGRIRLPKRFRRSEPREEGRVWNAILDRVLKRPLLSVVVSAGVLLALAAPALNLHTTMPGYETYPQSLGTIKTYNKMQASFPGEAIPANVIVQADDVRSAEVWRSLQEVKRQAVASGQMHEPITESVNDAGTVAVLSIPVDGNGSDSASNRALETLRDDLLPATVGQVDAVSDYGVSGTTASSKDFNDQMKSAAPLVFAFVLLFAFGLLLVTFRSLVIAVKAIVLNLLSVAAAYGILVLVFQHGWGKGLLGFEYDGGIVAFLPIFLFVILFGLSMDYHVFIVSRIREAFDGGMKTEDAVAHGIKTTAKVVTSAAFVMVGVFGLFATLSMLMLKQFGVGLATAVLIDATIVRAVLLPATMKLLGDWNWYLPRWLEWLPRLEHEASVPAAPELEVKPAPTRA